MSDEILYRAASLTPGVGRTVFGLVVPYNQTADVRDGFSRYRERFAAGSFRRSIAERGNKIRLFVGHDTKKLAIGKPVELFEQADGVHAAFEISDTVAGNDALESVRNGFADSFSIGFRPLRHRMDGDVLVRTECAIREVSLVGLPNYEGATIAGVRSEGPTIQRSIAEASLRLLEI
jgi:HK97 family phage prohead protease